MASERYPDWVKKFRPKGCIVKRKGAVYQVYMATSKRAPGKKYPVVEVGEMVGTIDPSGFHGKTRMVSPTSPSPRRRSSLRSRRDREWTRRTQGPHTGAR